MMLATRTSIHLNPQSTLEKAEPLTERLLESEGSDLDRASRIISHLKSEMGEWLGQANISIVREGAARVVARRILERLPEFLQTSCPSACGEPEVTNAVLVFLDTHSGSGNRPLCLVDDVLVRNLQDPTLHGPGNLQWLEREATKQDGWNEEALVLEEASLAFQPEHSQLSMSSSAFFEGASQIFQSNKPDYIVLESRRVGLGIPYNSASGNLSCLLLFLVKNIEGMNFDNAAAVGLMALRVIETAITIEQQQLADLVDTIGSNVPPRGTESREIEDIVKLIHRIWQAPEVSISKKSGPFAVFLPEFSLKKGKWYGKSRLQSPLWHQIWGSRKPTKRNGRQRTGYVGYALARNKPYSVPFVFSYVKRDGLVPRTTYDPNLSNELGLGILSQYTVVHVTGAGFHVTFNLGFSRLCGLLSYQRTIVSSLLMKLTRVMYKKDWDESEYYVTLNAQRAVKTLRKKVDDALTDNQAKRSERLPELHRMFRRLQRQFVTRKGRDPDVKLGHTSVEQVILEKIADDEIELVTCRQRGQDFVVGRGISAGTSTNRWSRLKVKSVVVNQCRIQILREDLESILENLIENALEADAKNIQVTVRKEEWHYPTRRRGAELVVADDGREVPDSIEHAMFERGRSGKTSEEESYNLGLGLWIVDQYCRDYGLFLEYRKDPTSPSEEEAAFTKEFAILFPEGLVEWN